MQNKLKSRISNTFSKLSLRRQLILLILFIFTVLGIVLFVSVSHLMRRSIFLEQPLLGLSPVPSDDTNANKSEVEPNPIIVLDVESTQAAALLRLQSSFQKIFGISLLLSLALGLALAIWLSSYLSKPIKNLTHEITTIDKKTTDIYGYNMPSQELQDLHDAIVSSLESFEKQFETQNQYLLDVAHEFRTPVSSLRMKIDVSKKKENISPEDYHSLCQVIDRSTVRLEELLDKLKRISDNENQIKVSNTSLAMVFKESINLLTPLAETRKIEIESQIDPGIYLRTDPLFLQTIITNLIENAIMYNVENGKIKISAEELDEGCRFKVVDTGVGISENEIKKLFIRFYRVDKNRSSQSGGLGLGLPIVKALLNSLGGQISIQSKLGVGTEVDVFVPHYQETVETSVKSHAGLLLRQTSRIVDKSDTDHIT